MKYYFWILGCAMNYSDSERMATVLDSLGYSRTLTEKEADLFIVISCSVRESAILKIYGKVKELNEYKAQNPNFRTILTGCVLEKDRKKLSKVFDVIIDMKDLDKLPNLLAMSSLFTIPGISIDPSERDPRMRSSSLSDEAHLRVDDKDDNDHKSSEYLSITPTYESPFRAYVPISTGCDNFCSYCAVPYTKGREVSRPMEEIVSEVHDLIENGYKEITLLGQNVNSYGNDFNKTVISSEVERSNREDSSTTVGMTKKDNNAFITLLTQLDAIPGDYRIYFYSNHPKDMSEELIATLATLKHFPHYIHLPLQSGSDEILRKMNRHSTKEQYLELVKKIRKSMPDVNLTTDIIVGFPGESEDDFQKTADVMELAGYDMAFIAQYSQRSSTAAAKMDDNVTKDEKKRRELVLQEIVKRTVLSHNQKLVGTTQRVLIDEQKGDKYFGRTEGYKVVEINPNVISSNVERSSRQISPLVSLDQNDNNKTDQLLEIGQFIDVKIESASSWKLFGTIPA